MLIRQAAEEDITNLRQIYYDSRKTHFTWLDSKQIDFSDFDLATMDEMVWLVEEQGEILGFLSLYEPENFIHLFFIKPGQEGKGIGRLLLGKIMKNQCQSLSLKCLTRNQRAFQFYTKYGFVVISEGVDQQDGPFYLMEKAIE